MSSANLQEEYKKGLHLISEFSVEDPDVLKDLDLVKNILNQSIEKHKLCKVGEVFHAFPDAGYTGIICLTESHISIHTWPEFNRVTFDVFLSNFKQENDFIVEAIHQEVISLLKAHAINITRLRR